MTVRHDPKPLETQTQDASDPFDADLQRLIDWFREHESVVVAFSGGVDSSVVLAAALASREKFGTPNSVVALTAQSPSVAGWQIELARQVAAHLQAEHQLFRTDEVDRKEYQVNDSRRCYYCKSTLYGAIESLLRHRGGSGATVVSGTNADDLGDYRPGIQAGDRVGIRKPLAELGVGKSAVRALAQVFGLPNADLPASPCLASRIAYGVEVTVQRLRQIEQAEDYLRSAGFVEFRVRLHEGDLARIEVTPDQFHPLLDPPRREAITYHLRELGFRYVTLDLLGFESGSMNRQLVSLSASGTQAVSGMRSAPGRGTHPSNENRDE